MAGPYPPEYGVGPVGPQSYPQPYPQESFSPAGPASMYPGMLPPPVPYPKRKRWRLVAAVVLAVAVVAGLVTAIVLAGRNETATADRTLTEASAEAAIQEYLDALANGDDETVARHTLCGLFDAVEERRSDLALASLSGDAFRRQYGSAQVISVDKVVRTSPHQAQVLFTMQVTPATRAGRQSSTEEEQQAVAQLLAYDNEILVCSYLPRTGGQY